MVRGQKIVGGEFTDDRDDETFDWFQQMAPVRRSDLVKRLVEGNYINLDKILNVASEFQIAASKVKQAWSWTQFHAKTLSAFTAIANNNPQSLQWENQNLAEKITRLERRISDLLKEQAHQKNIINRFLSRIEREQSAQPGTLGRQVWLQIQDISKQNEALKFQIKQLGLEVQRLFREKQEHSENIDILRQEIEGFKYDIQNLENKLAYHEEGKIKAQKPSIISRSDFHQTPPRLDGIDTKLQSVSTSPSPRLPSGLPTLPKQLSTHSEPEVRRIQSSERRNTLLLDENIDVNPFASIDALEQHGV